MASPDRQMSESPDDHYTFIRIYTLPEIASKPGYEWI